jgi:hypothetical protein
MVVSRSSVPECAHGSLSFGLEKHKRMEAAGSVDPFAKSIVVAAQIEID